MPTNDTVKPVPAPEKKETMRDKLGRIFRDEYSGALADAMETDNVRSKAVKTANGDAGKALLAMARLPAKTPDRVSRIILSLSN